MIIQDEGKVTSNQNLTLDLALMTDPPANPIKVTKVPLIPGVSYSFI